MKIGTPSSKSKNGIPPFKKSNKSFKRQVQIKDSISYLMKGSSFCAIDI